MKFKVGDKVKIVSPFEKCRADIGTEGIIQRISTSSIEWNGGCLAIRWSGSNHCNRCMHGGTCYTGTYNLIHLELIKEMNRNGANA